MNVKTKVVCADDNCVLREKCKWYQNRSARFLAERDGHPFVIENFNRDKGNDKCLSFRGKSHA